HRGEQAELTCSDLALCADSALEFELGVSSKPVLPPSKVVFRLTLCDFEPAKDLYYMSAEEKLEFAVGRKDAGAALFKQKRWSLAMQRYKQVLEAVGHVEGFREARSRERAK
ncbi:unnamed protein product, partial [Polarella glacialis]